MNRILSIITIVFLLVPRMIAEDKPSEQPMKIKSRTELVLVPTLVQDRSGAPMHKLSKDDFSVLENGKEQKIAIFDEVNTTTDKMARQKLPPGQFSNIVIGRPSARRVTVILVDALNTAFADRAYAHDHLLKFLKQIPDTTEPIGLLMLDRKGVHVVHDFTTDSSVLVRALQQLRVDSQPLGQPQETVLDMGVRAETQAMVGMLQSVENAELSYQAFEREWAATVTLQAMQQIARAYAGIPGRKSLIWASGGFPLSISDISQAMLSPGAPSITDMIPLYEQTWDMLNAANMALYPVDVRGVVALSPDAAPNRRRRNASERMRWSDEETLATFREFADITGGKAYVNTNDLADAFRRAMDDGTSYYVLGYYLSKENHKPGWYKLQVKVRQAGAQVRSRNGFYIGPEDKHPAKTKENDVNLAVNSPLEFTSLPVMARWLETTGTAAKRTAKFEIVLPANIASIDESDNNHMSIEFGAVARNAAGQIVGTAGQTVEAHLKPASVEQIRTSGVTYHGAVELPPGEYSVKFVVRDNLNGRLGSVAASLTVKQ